MRRFSVGACVALIGLAAAPADAVVMQSVLTVVEQPNGAEDLDGDRIEGFDQDDIDRDILAETVTPLHRATASAGVFGAVGLEAFALGAGIVVARADIEATFVNDTGRPGLAVSQFIVDGGSLSLLAAAGAQAELGILVSAVTGMTQGDIFNARVEAQAIQDFGAFVVNNVEDDVIATRFDPTAVIPTVVIDPFLRRLDLGVVGANESVTIRYAAVAVIDALTQDVEVGRVTFSDPLTVNIAPPTFIAIETVPLPPAGAALLGGLAVFGRLAARRRRRAWRA
ncbi:MAG: hypothetical protein RIM80_10380, partial [Alphaproteobacteria bacterium]